MRAAQAFEDAEEAPKDLTPHPDPLPVRGGEGAVCAVMEGNPNGIESFNPRLRGPCRTGKSATLGLRSTN